MITYDAFHPAYKPFHPVFVQVLQVFGLGEGHKTVHDGDDQEGEDEDPQDIDGGHCAKLGQ